MMIRVTKRWGSNVGERREGDKGKWVSESKKEIIFPVIF
jgi:hypothetical protein